ncbi:MAG: A/G-specific adenine glycosylase [Betaproteobacteria bacterium]|nr:MAG: A/G-specific adenine glycosylase [Betaproteobacteria bacterium]
MNAFARRIVRWQPRHGRHGLPWQGTRDAYRVWLSEVMLQQTQVDAVTGYYRRFLARFPDLRALAQAPQDEVLRLWSGLGYYARARNLHATARELLARHGGRFPRSLQELEALPGIGRSTAAAIAVFAFGRKAAILDGNVKRVLARCFGIAGFPGDAAVQRELWALAGKLVPARSPRTYTQGLMDLGAAVCRRARPLCDACPVDSLCVARREGRIAELPAPRPRKAMPLRRAQWMVALQDGRVLLERRPSSGVWGGLWSFPELNGRDAASFGRSIGCDIAAVRRLPALEHAFTHFRLRVLPLLCDVRRSSARAERAGRLWLDVADAAQSAVPTPVRNLLAQLAARP